MLRQRLATAAVANAVLQREARRGASSSLRYDTLSERFIESVMEVIDDLELESVDDIRFGDGVLSVDTKQGTFVLNKQAPKEQLWLSSPVSGPHHYDMVGEGDAVTWRSDRDGHALHEKLEKELSDILGVPIVLPRAEDGK
jgi:frataxin